VKEKKVDKERKNTRVQVNGNARRLPWTSSHYRRARITIYSLCIAFSFRCVLAQCQSRGGKRYKSRCLIIARL